MKKAGKFELNLIIVIKIMFLVKEYEPRKLINLTLSSHD